MNRDNRSGGIGCGTVIFIVLFILKFFNLVDISWTLVFAPIWIPVTILIIIVIIYFIKEKFDNIF